MKKILKTIIASILVATMLICTVSASAFSDINDSAFVPETAGYYFSRYESEFDRNCLYGKDTTSSIYIYYLETDESYPFREAPEFLGAEIVGISVSDPSVFDNLIIGVDVAEGGTSIYLRTSVTLEFDSGKTMNIIVIPLVCENGVVAGENEVKFDIPNYDGESMTLNAYPLEEVIRTVELKNESNSAIAYLDYKGNIFFDNLDEKVIVINSSQEIVTNEYGYFVYSSRNYPILIGSEIIEGEPVKIKIFISGYAGDVEIASFNCNVREAYYSQNLDRVSVYAIEEFAAIMDETIEKYSTVPSFLFDLLRPVMVAEFLAKAIPVYFRYVSDIKDLYTDFVNDLL